MVALGCRGTIWGGSMARLLALTRRGVGLAVVLGCCGVGPTVGWGKIGLEVSCGAIAGVAMDTVVGIDLGLDPDVGLGPILGRTALGLYSYLGLRSNLGVGPVGSPVDMGGGVGPPDIGPSGGVSGLGVDSYKGLTILGSRTLTCGAGVLGWGSGVASAVAGLSRGRASVGL